MAELVDARDLKSLVPQGTCRFDSGPPHKVFLLFRAGDPRGSVVSDDLPEGVLNSVEDFMGGAPNTVDENRVQRADVVVRVSPWHKQSWSAIAWRSGPTL